MKFESGQTTGYCERIVLTTVGTRYVYTCYQHDGVTEYNVSDVSAVKRTSSHQ